RLQRLDLLGEKGQLLAQLVDFLLLAPDRAVELVDLILGRHQLGFDVVDAFLHGRLECEWTYPKASRITLGKCVLGERGAERAKRRCWCNPPFRRRRR